MWLHFNVQKQNAMIILCGPGGRRNATNPPNTAHPLPLFGNFSPTTTVMKRRKEKNEKEGPYPKAHRPKLEKNGCGFVLNWVGIPNTEVTWRRSSTWCSPREDSNDLQNTRSRKATSLNLCALSFGLETHVSIQFIIHSTHSPPFVFLFWGRHLIVCTRNFDRDVFIFSADFFFQIYIFTSRDSVDKLVPNSDLQDSIIRSFYKCSVILLNYSTMWFYSAFFILFYIAIYLH